MAERKQSTKGKRASATKGRQRSHHKANHAKNTAARKAAKTAMGQPRQRQRYTYYSTEVVEEIIARVANGEAVKSICREDRMPEPGTVFMWLSSGKHPEFNDLYYRAREAAGFACADHVIEMSQAAAGQVSNPEFNAGAAKVAQSGLIWAAERMAPRKHSPRQEITGAEGEAVQTQTAVQIYLPSNSREAPGRVIEHDPDGGGEADNG